MNEIIEKDIQNLIYEIRGVWVMLDSDLARLYECTNGTKSINLAVKRNIDKFPADFYFQLTETEFCDLKFQNETSSSSEHGGIRKLPFAFTESGVVMLATTIHTKIASQVSISIMRAFVAMRHYLIDNKDIYKSLNNINDRLTNHEKTIKDNSDKINYLFSKFDKKEQLFLEGETFDAYSNFINIFKEARDELIIIDSYADTTLLDIIKKSTCKVILITKNSDRLNDTDISRYNTQYHNLTIVRNNSFHDRYVIIDRKTLYQSGTSINNAGKKIFSIHKTDDNFIKEKLLEIIKDIINGGI